MTYIYTFHSHFFATRFHMGLKGKGIGCTLMPVPRRVSSSCGTCAKVSGDFDPLSLIDDGVEQLYRVEREQHQLLYESEE